MAGPGREDVSTGAKEEEKGKEKGGLGLWTDAHSDSAMQLWGFPGQLWKWACCVTTVLAQENHHA